MSLLVTEAWQTMSSPPRLQYLGCASSGLKPWTVGLVKYFEMYMKRTTVYSKLASANLLAAVEKTLSETQGLIQFPGQ